MQRSPLQELQQGQCMSVLPSPSLGLCEHTHTASTALPGIRPRGTRAVSVGVLSPEFLP